MTNLDLFWYFIQERNFIFKRKEAGLPKPWTADRILQQYKFTNIRRELDTVSQWVAEEWRLPHQYEDAAWFACAVSVLSNKVSSMEALGYPVPWNKKHYIEVMTEHGFGNAYMLTTHRKPIKKPIYYAEILDYIWNHFSEFHPLANSTLTGWWNKLVTVDGIAGFIAGQIIASAKHLPAIKTMPDFVTFAASGPGSRRGLNRVLYYHIDKTWLEGKWYIAAREVWEQCYGITGIVMDMQDFQNCLCEFDKYCRVKFNESGRPKNRYQGV